MKKAAIGMVALGSIALVAAIAARSMKLHKSKGEAAPDAAPETAPAETAQPA